MLHRRLLPFLGLFACALPLSGCQRGYQSAKELQKVERGPTHCAKSCQDLGMRMSAFVLVEADVAGCVCEPLSQQSPPAPYPAPPPPATPPEPVSRVSTGAAAGYVVLQARRAAEEERRRQQSQAQQTQEQQRQQQQWRATTLTPSSR